MTKVNVFEVKAKLSEYLDRALGGEEVIICRHNTPVAELRPIDAARVDPRPIGPVPGRPVFDLPASFFDPMPEEELELWDAVPVVSGAVAPRARKAQRPSKAAERKGGYARQTGRSGRRRS